MKFSYFSLIFSISFFLACANKEQKKIITNVKQNSINNIKLNDVFFIKFNKVLLDLNSF